MVVSGWMEGLGNGVLLRRAVFVRIDGFVNGFLLRALRRAVFVGLACVFASVGALVGIITGAVSGQTTETGFLGGAGIGAVAGAILAVEVLESFINGDSLSKIAIFASLLNGKIFREWVSPAMLKAYEWQISTLESGDRESSSDIFDVGSARAVPLDFVKKLPEFNVTHSKTMDSCGEKICCSVCIQDLKAGESARRLPICRHVFHLKCIDRWLLRHGSCPLCRQNV
ncbi:NEP1-interacting protein 1-like [Tasmannia lanceolata]|uniref:NEP1-interacting protein 1-like n=1 Tax=Tasmannia lanceolata TaxID=3420 RepID=UPI004063E315